MKLPAGEKRIRILIVVFVLSRHDPALRDDGTLREIPRDAARFFFTDFDS